MLFINDHSAFRAIHSPCLEPKEDDFLFCCDGDIIGLSSTHIIPLVSDCIPNPSAARLYCFGRIGKHKCFLWDGRNDRFELDFRNVRSACLQLSEAFQNAAVLGSYLSRWRSINRYCGQCGAAMKDSFKERARICVACNHTLYPRISPCIIVLVTHSDKMLLARSPHFPPGIFSVLAGFVELGETVEQAVAREVKEEVGIEVNQLEYICSQPWLFPDSLMLGFIAKYASGAINPNKTEIECAGWFAKDDLPKLPDTMSISRYLIDRHLEQLS